ncbi:MAG: hypothetical protein R2820_00275 [Cyclobacteriaceae bacterium]|nr:hypothetical protein [Cyclobacteriaceae bacterium]
MKIFQLTALLTILIASQSNAQSKDYNKDVSSIDGIITALYEVISGDASAPRDWDRFRNLFKPETRLIPTSKTKDGNFGLRSISPEEYVQMFTNNIKTGFFEVELSHTLEEYGTIAHVFSTYETRETKTGPVANRGINSIQLFKDKDRYYVVSIFWCAESMGFPIPDKYLK